MILFLESEEIVFREIIGSAIYDQYGEDMMVVEPIDFVLSKYAFKTSDAHARDLFSVVKSGTSKSEEVNWSALDDLISRGYSFINPCSEVLLQKIIIPLVVDSRLELGNLLFEDYNANWAFEKISPIKSSKRQRNAEEHKDLRSFNLTLTLLKLETKFDVQDRKWAVFIV